MVNPLGELTGIQQRIQKKIKQHLKYLNEKRNPSI